MVNRGLITGPRQALGDKRQTGTRAADSAVPFSVRMARLVSSPSHGSESYFFLPEAKPDCRLPTPFWLGAAAMVLIFSFFGFLVSRLLRCSPLAMPASRRFDDVKRL